MHDERGTDQRAGLPDLEQRRWRVVRARRSGSFVYAVRSTGVFCRPGCASRLPRRENVEFFDDARSAALAGYRPCKRCMPQLPDAPDPTADMVLRACALLSGDEKIANRDVAGRVGCASSHLQRCFRKYLGVTPQQFRRRVLAQRAGRALRHERTVTEAAYAAGYGSSSRFYDGVGRELGMKPRAARAGGAGESIEYAVAPCSLGHVLAAWTRRGVCEVSLGEDPAALVTALSARFPSARRERGPGRWVRALVAAIDRGADVDLPLDVRGTAFQQRVWSALRAIPNGRTRTYGELARAIGRPRAHRAVARACAQNVLAVVVPCHRVVATDGSLSGYRWGIERKRELLRRERDGRARRARRR